MPIEFRCPQCGARLRTGDDTAGKQAKCPTCGTVTPIPAQQSAPASSGDYFVPPPPPPLGHGQQNPYQSPGEYTSHVEEPAAGDFQPTIIDFGDIFSRTWNIFQQQWGMCLLTLFIVFIFNSVVGNVLQVGGRMLGLAVDSQVLAEVLSILGSLVGMLLSVWIGIGQTLIFLGIARGEPVEIGQLFSGGPYFLRILGSSIVVGVAVTVGFFLLIIPGIYLILLLWPFYMLIVDRNLGISDSLQLATKITEGNKATAFLLGLVAFALTAVSAIPCGIGLLLTIPLFNLMWPVAYLAMTGQPTADQRYRRMREQPATLPHITTP